MTLLSDWQRVLRRAWSIRIILLAALLTGVEAILPFIEWFLPVPPGIFAALAFVATGAAFVARLVAQKNLSGPK